MTLKLNRLALGAAAAALLTAAPLAGAPSALAQDARPPLAAAVPNGAPMSFADLIEEVSPAVVSVEVSGQIEPRMDERVLPNLPPQFREFFEDRMPEPQPRERRVEGSGFFISADGLVVTNNHVVDDANEIQIVLNDGERYQAEIVGTDAPTDIAVLRVIDADEAFPYVTLDRDPDIRVGDWVVAVGNPFGLGGTVTAGIVSAKGRPLGAAQAYTDFLQIDAPINRGNSGGPTFDLNGDVVGVNSAIFSPSGGNVGIGFAIPSDLAARIIDQLVEAGAVSRGYLGVAPQTLTAELSEGLGLDPDTVGVLLSNVINGTPAQDAGLEQGDVVIEVNGEPVEDARDLTRRIGAYAPGERVRLTILRDGEQRTVRVRLAERPGEQELASAPPAAELFGMTMESADEAARERFGIEEERGVLVTGVRNGSEAAEKGIRPGDVILEAGGEDVRTPNDMRAAAEAARERGRSAVLVLVATQGGVQYVALQFEDDEN